MTRFAPSPTGRLHLGHAYSAILAHDHARTRGGSFLLRIEDIDPGRTRAEFVERIMEDLAWLGLAWDGDILFQSQRLDLHAAALDRLRSMGLLYPCFCTRKAIAAEIAASASAPHGLEGPLYPGTCRRLPDAARRRLIAEQPHAWRLDMATALNFLPALAGGAGAGANSAVWQEKNHPRSLHEALGASLTWRNNEETVIAAPEQFGDVVLARKDAPASYHLAVTIDDAAQGITDVVRGEDLFAATHVHRLLQALLGLPTPVYRHHRLILGHDGQRLAKRNGAPSIAALRAAGTDPYLLAENLRAGRFPGGYSVSRT